MTHVWRKTLAIVMSLSMVTTSAFAEAASPEKIADKIEELKESWELLVPDRKGDTFSKAYYRIETRLNDVQKEEIAELNQKLGYKIADVKMPAMKTGQNSITLTDEGISLVFKIEKDKEGQPFISVNGKRVPGEALSSPLASYEFLKKLNVTKDANAPKKTSWLIDLLVPKASAAELISGLPNSLLLGGIGVLAVGTYLGIKYLKERKKSCDRQGQTCCSINGGLSLYSNACCEKVGGVVSAYGVGAQCPVSTQVDPNVGETTTTTTTVEGAQ